MSEARAGRAWVPAERVLLALWTGGLWAVGFLAAPVLFTALDDRWLAGAVAGRLFGLMGWVALGAGLLVLIGAAAWRGGRPWRWRTAAVALMLGLAGAGQFGIAPRMAAMQPALAGLAADHPQRRAFGRLHALSSALFLGQSLLGLMLVAAGGPAEAATRGPRPAAGGAVV